MEAWLLAAIVGLTLVEVGAVVAVSVFAPHDQTSSLVAILIGIVGPIVGSMVALVQSFYAHARASDAQQTAQRANQRVDQVAHDAGVARPPGDLS